MVPRSSHVARAAVTLTLLAASAVYADCSVRSGPKTAALIELYTSEGCSSCPPADRALSRLAEEQPSAGVIPLALHVDYWDYIGWRDPYAQSGFGERQRWLAGVGGRRSVYTPQFFAGGLEVGPVAGGLPAAIRAIQDRPARARLALNVRSRGAGFDLEVEATDVAAGPMVLQVAVLESRLTSAVNAGENRGETFIHDRVVRQWLPPVPVAGAHAMTRAVIAPKPAWRADQLAVVAFVQDSVSGEVLQAVQARQCIGRSGAT